MTKHEVSKELGELGEGHVGHGHVPHKPVAPHMAGIIIVAFLACTIAGSYLLSLMGTKFADFISQTQ